MLSKKFDRLSRICYTILKKWGVIGMHDKLRELVLYIAKKSEDDPAFGKTKLNKILFASDFYYFGHTGEKISGAKYVHLGKGPVPFEIPIVLEELQRLGRATIEKNKYFTRDIDRVIPKADADESLFKEEELSFVDEIIGHFRHFNATDLSNWTHTLVPWLITKDGEEIPYCTVFMLHRLPVERDGLDWAREEIEKFEETSPIDV